jgi:predicted esterase
MNQVITILTLLSLLCPICFGQPVQPTHRNLRYSKEFDRSVLDLWAVDGKKPAPLVVYFHGGGFKAGDKAFFPRSSMLRKYHPQGVAFASVNYPFLVHVGKDYLKIMNHCAEAIRFLKANSAKYNLDPDRISVSGGSAGAIITCHVGHAHNLGIRSLFPIQQPMGTPLLTIPYLRKGGPPIFVYNRSGRDDRVHHPDNALFVKKKCDLLGVECTVYGTQGSGLPVLPADQDVNELAMKFFQKSWKKQSKKKKKND